MYDVPPSCKACYIKGLVSKLLDSITKRWLNNKGTNFISWLSHWWVQAKWTFRRFKEVSQWGHVSYPHCTLSVCLSVSCPRPMRWATLSHHIHLTTMFSLTMAQHQWAKWPWNKTSKTMSQNKFFSPLNYQYLSQQLKTWVSHIHLNVFYSIMCILSLSLNFLWESEVRRDCEAVIQDKKFAFLFLFLNIHPSCFFTFLARNVKVRGRHYK